MSKKLTLKQVKKRCKKLNVVFLDEEYINANYKHNFLCIKHNKEFKSSVHKISGGHKLKCCDERMEKRLTLEYVKKELLKKGFMFLDSDFLGITKKYKIKCIKHNIEYFICIKHILYRNSELKCCSNENHKLSINDAKIKTKKISENYEFLENAWRGAEKRYHIKCNKHDTIHYILWTGFMTHKRLRCCFEEDKNTQVKMKINYIKKRSLELGYVFLDKEFNGVNFRHSFKCLKHGEIHKATTDYLFRKKSLKCCGIERMKKWKRVNGKDHPMWNPNLTEKDRMGNRGPGINAWKNLIKKKFNCTCQICGKENLDIGNRNCIAHHLESYNSNKKLRLDENNGTVMCYNCHNKFHHEYGFGNNTCRQFNKFKREYENVKI